MVKRQTGSRQLKETRARQTDKSHEEERAQMVRDVKRICFMLKDRQTDNRKLQNVVLTDRQINNWKRQGQISKKAEDREKDRNKENGCV